MVKSPSSGKVTQQRSRVEEKPQQKDQEMKKNPQTNPEYFGRRQQAREVAREDGLYDLPDDTTSIRSHASQAATQKDGHFYDDADGLESFLPSYTSLDKSKIAPSTVYDMPLDNEEVSQHREEKFYESIDEEESEEDGEDEVCASVHHRMARERTSQEEKNEREIREALRKQRLLKLTNARHINPPVQVYRVAVYDMGVYSVIDDLSLKF